MSQTPQGRPRPRRTEAQMRELLLAKERAYIASMPKSFRLDGLMYERTDISPTLNGFGSMVKFRVGRIVCELFGRGKMERYIRLVDHAAEGAKYAWYGAL